jgi:zearalenone synthase (highly reducing iterative type I polyketide synthase)
MEITLIEAAKPSKRARISAHHIDMTLQVLGYKITRFSWGSDVLILNGKSCISLLELETSILRDLTEQDFVSIKRLILGAASTFWVVGFDDPSAAMIDGLARVVRNENPGMSFRTFHAEQSSLSNPGHLGEFISRAFNSETTEDEFRIINGLLNVSRIEEDKVLNEEINDILPRAEKKITSMPLGQAQYPLKLCVPKPGRLDSVCLEPDELPETDLEDDQIEIQVKASSLK